MIPADLRALWEEVRPIVAKPMPKEVTKLPPGYADITKWKAGVAITLIHKSPDGGLTFLGNFREFTYPGMKDALRLVRVEEPVATEGTKEVTGEWWLTPHGQEAVKPQAWVEEREIVLGVTLTECGLHCPEALCKVRLMYGGIARVELMEATRFGCPARNSFIILPKGLDILGGMGLDSKLAMKAELEGKE